MASLTDELPLDQRLKERNKAYQSFVNIAQPMQEQKAEAQNTQLGLGGLRNVFKNVTQEGGYAGRQGATQAVDQTQLELAKAKGEQNATQDALNLQGAGMKEDLTGAQQQESIKSFNRQTDTMEETLNRAIAERSYELGITAKELAMHTNARVADIGMEQTKKDFDAGLVSRDELAKVSANLQIEADKFKQQANALLSQLQRESETANTAYGRDRAMQTQSKMLDAQKEAMKAQAKAANTAAIITGAFTIGGAVVGTLIAPGVGTALGASVGGAAGQMAAGATANS